MINLIEIHEIYQKYLKHEFVHRIVFAFDVSLANIYDES